MSLSSILSGTKRGDKKVQEILKNAAPLVKEFKTDNGDVAFSSYGIVVENRLQDATLTRMIGRAFDWYARLIVAREVKKGKTEVFQPLFEYLPEPYANEDILLAPKESTDGQPTRAEMYATNKVLKKETKKIKKEISSVKSFVAGAKKYDVKKVLDSAFFFACEEEKARSGNYSIEISVSERFLKELFDMGELFKERFVKRYVKADSVVKFNPVFGAGSEMVNGADADIIVDGMLVDFKTTQYSNAKNRDISQIVAYSALNHVEKDGERYTADSPKHEITSVAMYKARFGITESCEVGSFRVLPKELAEQLVELFN